ncbi:MAG: hypothetical protein JXO22_16210 [Phycisphaerae bacterium]|nr:hypothetical protein [Phycisphaerae bacterium]
MNRRHAVLAMGCAMFLLASGCSLDALESINIDIPGFTTIRVEIYNDTDWYVVPDIRFDDDSGSWSAFVAGLFGGESLSAGELEPGEIVEFTFDCDDLGLIFSDAAEQRDALGTFATAASSEILRRDEDFGCGDRITFQFIGDGDTFGVVVAVNGLIVD